MSRAFSGSCQHCAGHISARPASRALSESIKVASSRRCLGVTLLALAGASQMAGPAAAEVVRNESMPDSDPFIQEMLRKSEEKREERRKERLANYYKRNFKEYFEFEGGLAAKARGITPETSAKMRQWLKDNE